MAIQLGHTTPCYIVYVFIAHPLPLLAYLFALETQRIYIQRARPVTPARGPKHIFVLGEISWTPKKAIDITI